MQINSETIRQTVALLRKNAAIVEALLSARSVQLYDSGYSVETEVEGVVLNYYSLLGVNGDPEKVIPIPVLLQIFGLERERSEDLESFGAWLSLLPLSVAGTGDRNCFLRRHSSSTTRWIEHQPGCPCRDEHPWRHECSDPDFPEDFCGGCVGCPVHIRCNGCEAEWIEGEKTPSTNFEFQAIGLQPLILERLGNNGEPSPTVIVR